MKVGDLRIGNYVQIDGLIRTVCEIYGDGYITSQCDLTGRSKSLISKVKPLIITVSWLNKFSLPINFEHAFYTIYSFSGTEFQLINDYSRGLKKFNIAFEGNEIKTVHYVHQLQNLYYNLSNIDLKVVK